MKLIKGILAISILITMTAGAAWAQNPDAIDNARSVAKSLQQKQDNDSNAALNAAGVPASSKPAPGAPAPAVKPAAIPGSKPAPAPAQTAAAKPAPAAKPAAAPASASASHNQLQRVSVLQDGDAVRVEMNTNGSVTPRVSKLSSPARVLVELPGTIDATAKNHIAVGSAGIKGIRIGMDGKTPPTTSVVVDLDQACAYELTPGSGDKLALILHTQGAPIVAKSSPAPAPARSPAPAQAKTPAPAAQPQTVAKAVAPAVKPQAAAQPTPKQPAPAPAAAKTEAKKTEPAKPVAAKTETKTEATKTAAAKTEPAKPAPQKVEATKDAKPAAPAAAPASDATKTAEAKPKPQDKKWAMSGKRDPFFSPVVQQSGSGCTTGKKCLEIGNINLRGVVKSDTGFIAVVTNSLNKAYFLRENDPVFNGYVMKITGDSVVFQETVQDKLGKPFTREVVKRIYTPAV